MGNFIADIDNYKLRSIDYKGPKGKKILYEEIIACLSKNWRSPSSIR